MNLDLSTFLDFFTRLIVILMVTPIHECAHAWAAFKLGDDTASIQGRMTLNPLAHLDPVGTICLLLAGFGWAKPVPVNARRFDRKISMRGGMALTALAGPASNILVAIIGMVAFRVFCCFEVVQVSVADYYLTDAVNTYFILYYMLQAFIFINLGLAIFNLIPIPPLDGSHILGYFANSKVDAFFYKYQRVISIVFMVILVTGMLSKPINFVEGHIYNLMITLTNWIPKLLGTL
ncbi:site-2 protease family protein [Ruminococcus sp.]|uniref:site-2 protease family protein n=1 Tax=Ruminococcus sp. TaxID=41978 RepID=UPI00261E7069|nr:site-2 protease family protein [Ruminococcus sp.]MDD7555824.1 site-2 protease family protein [Ruminococcus sp.]